MEITTNGKRKFKEEEKVALVGRYEGSGLGQGEFCKREGISVSALQSWKRKRAGGGASKFVELPVERASTAVREVIELKLPHGIMLRIVGEAA